MQLFASILRREEDGHYYLVTPVEKWRIAVDLHPLMVVEVQRDDSGVLQARLNTERRVSIDQPDSLFLEPAVGDVAALRLRHGLTALFTRAAWYDLVEMCDDSGGIPIVASGEHQFALLK